MSNNSNIEFIDTSNQCYKEMVNLSKKALKAGGKVVTKILREKIPVRTGGLKKSITAWAKVNRKTGVPYMEIGYRSRAQMRKRGVNFFVNPAWFEFGTKSHVIMTQEFKKDGKSSYKLTNKDSGAQFGVIVQHPGMKNKNFLRNTVYDNIDAIKQAQIEYLGQLTNTMISAGAKIEIDEEDEEID
mgnify:FL=1